MLIDAGAGSVYIEGSVCLRWWCRSGFGNLDHDANVAITDPVLKLMMKIIEHQRMTVASGWVMEMVEAFNPRRWRF